MPNDRSMLVSEIKATLAQNDLQWGPGFKGWKAPFWQEGLVKEWGNVARRCLPEVYVLRFSASYGHQEFWCCIWHQPIRRDLSRDRQEWLRGFEPWFKRGRKLLEAQRGPA